MELTVLEIDKIGRLIHLTAILFGACLGQGIAVAETPNIVVILVDDMGYGDPGCFNSESRIPTPNIDALARDGMKFTDAHASGPLCHLSRYGLMTGRYPFRTDVGKWRKTPTIEPDRPTLPGFLKSCGYQTAMVGKWHLGFKENGYENPLPGGPADRGFDSFFGIRASTDIPPYFYIRGKNAVTPPTDHIEDNFSDGWTKIQGEFWRAGGIAPGLQLKDVLPRFTNEAVQVIESFAKSETEAPLMLYLAYPAPHTPWLPSEEFAGKSGAGMYGDFAMMVDDNIGKITESLRQNGLEQETLVIFTSDNGPVWYEQDVRRLGHDSSGGLRGMKSDAWECGHRMPFIVKWPGRVAPGTSSDALISFVDVFATAADIVGRPLPESAAPDSFSFSDVLMGTVTSKTPVRRHLALKSGGGMRTLRSGKWKLILGLGSGGFSKPSRIRAASGDPKGQLYDLNTDRAEVTNLYDRHPELVGQLTEMLNKIESAQGQRFLR